jgi:oligopeptide/dipeptide ABC transporter ATP-binding protein
MSSLILQVYSNLQPPQSGGVLNRIGLRLIKKYFSLPGKGWIHAVDDVSFEIFSHETMGLVGESGCGKSTIGNILVKLLEPTSGEIFFEDTDLLKADKNHLRGIRRKIQMIFQDPFSSLNPRQTVAGILSKPYIIHKLADGTELKKKIEELAETVGLESYVLKQFPHELDGGRRQMVGIARALALNPQFIVCDEPVSSLDVSVQATIINLLINMREKMGLSYLFISHDLSVVRHISNRVAVMYLGQIIEFAETDAIFSNTLHPYSIALLSAVPTIDLKNKKKRIVLKGDVPSPLNPKPTCRFAPRCWMVREKCRNEDPPFIEGENGHFVACHFWEETRDAAIKKTVGDIKGINFQGKEYENDHKVR